MKKYITVLVILFLSCKTDQKLIHDDTFYVELLSDLYMAEASIEYEKDIIVKDSIRNELLAQILEFHNIDTIEYNRIEEYLKNDLTRYNSLTDRIKKVLSEKQKMLVK